MAGSLRQRLIVDLKQSPRVLSGVWAIARLLLNTLGHFTKLESRIVFSSFGGRKFDDSPRALYEEICRRPEFDNWELVWAFVDPCQYELPRGKPVKIDTPAFFKLLLTSRVWIGNSGIDRGIGLRKHGVIRVETWHGAPIKKIGGEENQTSMRIVKKQVKNVDASTIRCAQSAYDREIFARVMNASLESFLMCGLPRNDSLLRYSQDEISAIRTKLGIPDDKRVIMYAPTYREYLVDSDSSVVCVPPIDLGKWRQALADSYVLLFRAHYAVNKVMGIKTDDFVIDVSDYPTLNDLYVVSDAVISDYSSIFIDYSILERPMFCFAYDLKEYEEKRGLYIDLEEELPCCVDSNEDDLIAHILGIDYEVASAKARLFHRKYAPYSGRASAAVVDEIVQRLQGVRAR